MRSAIQIQWPESVDVRPDLDVSETPVAEHFERASVMIPAAVGFEKRLESFWRLPMGRQQCRSGGIALAEHEREMVRIPIGTPGGIGDEEVGSGGGTELGQIAVREIPVLPDIQPFPRMRQRGMCSKTSDLEQLLLRGKHQPDRTEFVD